MITLRAPQRDRVEPEVAPRRRHLRVVERADEVIDEVETRRRSASGAVGTILVLLLFACIFGVVVFQVFLVQTQSHLDDLGHKIATEDARAKQLRLDTANLESPDRILRDGERLHMIPPGEIGFLQPKPDDDAKGAFDPTKETVPVPTSTVPTAPVGGTGTQSTTPVTAPKTTTKATTTPTTAPKTTTTAKSPTTTTKSTTTTTKPKTTTTTTRTGAR